MDNINKYFLDILKKKYAEFSGRAGRKEFWMFFLINLIFSILVSIVDQILGLTILSTVYSLALFIPNLAIGFRRLHDIGKSAWWMLLCLIPVVGWIILIVFAAQEGEPGDNSYGPNPRGSAPVAPVATV